MTARTPDDRAMFTSSRKRGYDLPGVTKARHLQLDHVDPEATQTARQISLAEPERHHQAPASKLLAGLEQVQQNRLGPADLGRRLKKEELAAGRPFAAHHGVFV